MTKQKQNIKGKGNTNPLSDILTDRQYEKIKKFLNHRIITDYQFYRRVVQTMDYQGCSQTKAIDEVAGMSFVDIGTARMRYYRYLNEIGGKAI